MDPKYYSEDFRPDVQFVFGDGIPLLLLEAKRPLISGHLLLKDERKLLSMMKLSLDRMVKEAMVKDPTVIGMRAQSKLQVYRVSSSKALAVY